MLGLRLDVLSYDTGNISGIVLHMTITQPFAYPIGLILMGCIRLTC